VGRQSCFSHGIKGFVIPTTSFVRIGIRKIFCYNNKMFSSINKTFGCCSKILVAATKQLFVVPNFVAVTKPFFSVLSRTAFYTTLFNDNTLTLPCFVDVMILLTL